MWRSRNGVAVRSGEAGDGKARHEEGVEDTVLDEIDATCRLAFVVIAVVAAEGDAVEGGEGGSSETLRKVGRICLPGAW